MGCFFAALLAGYRPNSNPPPEENATDSATTEGDKNIPVQPGFDLDRYLDEFYKHVEGGVKSPGGRVPGQMMIWSFSRVPAE